MKPIIASILSLIFLLTLWSCAQRGRPDGGPKDKEPPQFVSSKPANYSINYNDENVIIKFDEFVQLNNPRQQIIVSPPLADKPIITPSSSPSKEFIIEMPRDSLLDNTTYTINFGTSIEDYNEANVFPYFKYVFSTGPILDSLKLSGRVFDAKQRLPDENISVVLYQLDSTYSDSTVFQSPPTYIAYTDSTSAFTIENIKAGSYKLFAIKDKNANYTFESDTDKIGFLTDTIQIPTQKTYDLIVFKDFTPVEVNRPKQVSRLQLEFGYKGQPESPEIKLISKLDDSINFQSRILKHPEKDTLQYWYKPYIDKDSLLFTFKNAGQLIDTLEVNPKQIELDSLRLSQSPSSAIGFFEALKLRANTPISTIDTSKISILSQDSTKVNFSSQLKANENTLELNFEKVEKTSYNINLLPGAITDFYEETNDTISYRVSTASYADFGNLELSVDGITTFPVIGELVDKDGKLIKSLYNTNSNIFNFRYISPGTYYFRLIYDTNKNGVWDSGNYLESKQPEVVLYEPKPFEIRAFFDYVQRISLK